MTTRDAAAAAAAQPAYVDVRLSQLAAVTGAGSNAPQGSKVPCAQHTAWSCFAWHACGELLAAGSARGLLLVCSRGNGGKRAALDSGVGCHAAGSWRRADEATASRKQPSTELAAAASSLQLLGSVQVPQVTPLTAVAWQPVAAGAATDTALLLAFADRAAVCLAVCRTEQHASAAVSGGAPLTGGTEMCSRCTLPAGSRAQLVCIAWADTTTIAAGDSDGNCHVLQVR